MMLFSSAVLHRVVFQIQYADAYELWDRAGAISRRLCEIWPALSLREGQPLQQVLVGKDIEIQTGLSQSTVTISGAKALESSRVQQLSDTFVAWRTYLELSDLKRISTRAIYSKKYQSLKEANAAVFGLGLVKWPSEEVFNQARDSDKNSIDVTLRFEDDESFTLLRVKAEQLKYEVTLDPYFMEEPDLERTINRVVFDFDRGLLGNVAAEKIRVDEWIKGFRHVLNRDITKVLGR